MWCPVFIWWRFFWQMLMPPFFRKHHICKGSKKRFLFCTRTHPARLPRSPTSLPHFHDHAPRSFQNFLLFSKIALNWTDGLVSFVETKLKKKQQKINTTIALFAKCTCGNRPSVPFQFHYQVNQIAWCICVPLLKLKLFCPTGWHSSVKATNYAWRVPSELVLLWEGKARGKILHASPLKPHW